MGECGCDEVGLCNHHRREVTEAEMEAVHGGLLDATQAKGVEARRERDRWIRAFNRLEKAVTSHKNATSDFQTEHDEALYAAHGSIMRTLCGTGETEL